MEVFAVVVAVVATFWCLYVCRCGGVAGGGYIVVIFVWKQI